MLIISFSHLFDSFYGILTTELPLLKYIFIYMLRRVLPVKVKSLVAVRMERACKRIPNGSCDPYINAPGRFYISPGVLEFVLSIYLLR